MQTMRMHGLGYVGVKRPVAGRLGRPLSLGKVGRSDQTEAEPPSYTRTPMRERRRAGAAVIPQASPPADRAFLQPQFTRPPDHQYDSWRVLRFVSEFVDGFDALADIGPAVTCFGSARIGAAEPLYQRAMEVGAALARRGVTGITGGRPGRMEALNPRRLEARGRSIGRHIGLPGQEAPNDYVQ